MTLNLTRWPSYTNSTRILWRYTRYANMHFLRQGFRKLPSDRQTWPKLYHAASPVVKYDVNSRVWTVLISDNYREVDNASTVWAVDLSAAGNADACCFKLLLLLLLHLLILIPGVGARVTRLITRHTLLRVWCVWYWCEVLYRKNSFDFELLLCREQLELVSIFLL